MDAVDREQFREPDLFPGEELDQIVQERRSVALRAKNPLSAPDSKMRCRSISDRGKQNSSWPGVSVQHVEPVAAQRAQTCGSLIQYPDPRPCGHGPLNP
jgi:hypothetical protein